MTSFRGRSIKMLGAGSAILFASLGCYLTLIDPGLERFGGEAGGRWRHARDRAASLAIRFPFTLQYAREVGRCRDRRLARLSESQLHHHAAWAAAFLLMLMANVLMIYRAGPAAVVRTGDRARRPQQRALFHQMVSEIPAREVRKLRRALSGSLNIARNVNENIRQGRHDDERRVRQTRHRLPLHHRVPRVYLITDNVLLATGVAIAGAVAQVIYAHLKGQQLGFMTYASLALVIVLGGATLLTSDPRFVLAKPAIAHFAIGAIMLKRGWMLRYMPPIVIGDHSGIRHPGGLCLGRADVRARRRHHRDRADRRHETVGDLCVGGGDRCENRGLCRAICRVSHAGHEAGFAPSAPDRYRDGWAWAARCAIPPPEPIRLPEPFRFCEQECEETKMAVDGNWNIIMSTPMGDRNATLTLKNSGGALTGTQAAEGNSTEIFDGTANGDDVAWKVSITNPMPLTLEFTGKVVRRQHLRRNGHRPDGQFSVQGDEGVNGYRC